MRTHREEIDRQSCQRSISLDANYTPPESQAESPRASDKGDVRTPALCMFGRDLTELAKMGQLDPLIRSPERDRTPDSDPLATDEEQRSAAP